MKKILLADDHLVVRLGTSLIIEKKFPNTTIHQAEDYDELLTKIKKENYELIFLDINMPGTKGELMISEIREINIDTKILIFSVYEENVAVKYLLKGADGYLNKLCDQENIIQAIESIMLDGFYYSPQIIKQLFLFNQKKVNSTPFDLLTAKEKEIAHLLMNGNGNLEISNKLNIAMSTISTYKKKIFRKLNITNTIELFNLYGAGK